MKTSILIAKLIILVLALVLLALAFRSSAFLKGGGLQGAWRFENNGNDWSGAGFNGTVSSTVTTSGKFGRAYSFNGSADRIALGTGSVAICPSAAPFTVAAWVKFTSTSTAQGIYGRPDQCSFQLTAAGKLYFLTERVGDRVVFDLNGTTVLATNTWYHVAATAASGELDLYLNGAQDASTTSATASWFDQTAQNVAIGALDNSPYFRFFNGTMDEVQVFNKVLTQSEIRSLMLGYLPKEGTSF